MLALCKNCRVQPSRVADNPATDSAEVVDALIVASRALVGVAARSLAGLPTDITLPQFRALMVLATRGPQRMVDISNELAVNASTGTRMCDRLVAKGLVRRTRGTSDRRAVRLALSASGRALVEEVNERRRIELAGIVSVLPRREHPNLVRALRALAAATGEAAPDQWWLGWADVDDSGP